MERILERFRKKKEGGSKGILITQELINALGYEPSISLPPVEGGRGLRDYETRLYFSRNELHGKRVLDLGSGTHAKFAKELESDGIAADVISISPEYSELNYAKPVREGHPEGKQLAALGQRLPFPDNTFDRIYALHVFKWIISKEVAWEMFGEMGRILKAGGNAKMGPIQDIPGEYYPYELIGENQTFICNLERIDVSFYREHIPTHVMPLMKVKDRDGSAFDVPSYTFVLLKEPRS